MGVVSCSMTVEGLNAMACTATACDRNQTSFISAEEFWLFATIETPNGECCWEELCSTWWLKGLLTPFIWHQSAHTFVPYWNCSFICTSSDSDPPLCVPVLHDSAVQRFLIFLFLCFFSYPCCSQEQRVSRIIPWLHLEPFSKWDKTVKARNFLKKSQCSIAHDQGTHGHYRATNWPRLCLTSFLNLYCVEFTSSFTTSWIRYVNEHCR